MMLMIQIFSAKTNVSHLFGGFSMEFGIIDHITPISKSGTDNMTNFLP